MLRKAEGLRRNNATTTSEYRRTLGIQTSLRYHDRASPGFCNGLILMQANPKYISVNWEAGGGGAFAVIPLDETGRLPEQLPLFRGHTAVVLDTDWYVKHLLAKLQASDRLIGAHSTIHWSHPAPMTER